MSHPTLRELDDLKLALLAKMSADTDAYGVLAERHYPSLRAFLLRMTGDRSQADDLAQDALIRGFERIGSFRADAAFRTWLFSIAHREFLQSRRKAGAIRRMIERFTEPHDSKHAGEAIDTHDLRKGLSALREDERQVVEERAEVDVLPLVDEAAAVVDVVEEDEAAAGLERGAALGDEPRPPEPDRAVLEVELDRVEQRAVREPDPAAELDLQREPARRGHDERDHPRAVLGASGSLRLDRRGRELTCRGP